MFGTRVQLEVEDWVRKEWIPQHFEMNFYRERLKIRSGGVFDFDRRIAFPRESFGGHGLWIA